MTETLNDAIHLYYIQLYYVEKSKNLVYLVFFNEIELKIKAFLLCVEYVEPVCDWL